MLLKRIPRLVYHLYPIWPLAGLYQYLVFEVAWTIYNCLMKIAVPPNTATWSQQEYLQYFNILWVVSSVIMKKVQYVIVLHTTNHLESTTLTTVKTL